MYIYECMCIHTHTHNSIYNSPSTVTLKDRDVWVAM